MSLLPDEFAELETFAAIWAIDGSAARAHKRDTADMPSKEAFFTAMAPRMKQVLEHLDRTPLEQHDGREQNLMNLVLSFAHVALAVEVQGPDEAQHAQWRPRMVLTRTAAGV